MRSHRCVLSFPRTGNRCTTQLHPNLVCVTTRAEGKSCEEERPLYCQEGYVVARQAVHARVHAMNWRDQRKNTQTWERPDKRIATSQLSSGILFAFLPHVLMP